MSNIPARLRLPIGSIYLQNDQGTSSQRLRTSDRQCHRTDSALLHSNHSIHTADHRIAIETEVPPSTDQRALEWQNDQFVIRSTDLWSSGTTVISPTATHLQNLSFQSVRQLFSGRISP